MRLFALLLLLYPLTAVGQPTSELSLPLAEARLSTHTPAPTHVPGAILLVRQLNHARAALKTAEALREQERFATVPIEIVVCGQGSEHLLRTSGEVHALLTEAERLKVRLLACGMSLRNLGYAPADLAEGIEVVPNGLLHALERQADGFVSVEL